MLELQTLGGLELRTEAGERVEALAGRTKCLALLAYLAAEAPGGRVPRQEVASVLWPDRTDGLARNSLRVALTHIRRATGRALVGGEGASSLRLVRDHLRADVLAFREAVEAGDDARALELYRGDFLAGVHGEAEPFQRWADERRGRFRHRAYEAALSLGTSAREAGDLASAEAAFRAALDLAPLREEAAGSLIRTLADRGRAADAVQLYEAFRRRRREELELPASAELEELVEELKTATPVARSEAADAASAGSEDRESAEAGGVREAAGTVAREARGAPPRDTGGPAGGRASRGGRFGRRILLAGLVALGLLGGAVAGAWHLLGWGGEATPRAGDRSVAVLPFEEIGTENPGPIAEGLHNDLLTRLSHLSGLEVISATSVDRYRNSDLPLPTIADSLGVAWVVEGGVQRAGDRIQVNAQLIDPRADTHAWAESYQRELTAENLFDVQRDITRRIARSLTTRLAGKEEGRRRRQVTDNLEAYRLYVQGRGLLKERTMPEMRRGLQYFRQAVARDSGCALAWAGMADALTLLMGTREADPDTLLPAASNAARRALELAPDLAEAHAAIGRVQVYRREGPAALRELKRAVELRPSYAAAHAWLAKLQLILGRPEQALSHVERAARLDPMSPENRLILMWARLANGEPEAALRAARRTAEIQPRYVRYGGPEMFALFHLGEVGEMRARVRQQGDSATERPLVAIAAARASDPGPARELLATLDEDEAPLTSALVRAAIGDEARAYDALRTALHRKTGIWNHGPIHARYLFPDVLAPLRDDPRFEELLREINRSWGLNPDGSLPEQAGDRPTTTA